MSEVPSYHANSTATDFNDHQHNFAKAVAYFSNKSIQPSIEFMVPVKP